MFAVAGRTKRGIHTLGASSDGSNLEISIYTAASQPATKMPERNGNSEDDAFVLFGEKHVQRSSHLITGLVIEVVFDGVEITRKFSKFVG